MPALRMIKGDTPGAVFPLDRDMIVIGKSPFADLVLASRHVSKIHACISRTADGIVLTDLRSTNGTEVNGERVSGRRRLDDGDVIKICGFQFGYLAAEGVDERPTILRELDATQATSTLSGHGPEAADASGEKLRAILGIVADLTGVIEPNRILDGVLDGLFRQFPQAERALILERRDGARWLRVRAARFRDADGPDPAQRVVSRTLFDYVLREGRAILCEDVPADDRFRSSGSLRESQVRTLMCSPLRDSRGEPAGVLQVDTRDHSSRFTAADLDVLVAVSGMVGMAVENARMIELADYHKELKKEARDARAVQFALLPSRPPKVEGYAFWHAYEPARFVGGDAFDYRPLPRMPAATGGRGRWAVALGDVSGKGMPAALVMARLSSDVRVLLQSEAHGDPALVVERLNRDLCAEGTAERFVTFLLAVLDADRHELAFVNAGHPRPLIRRADGRIETFTEDRSGPLLGVIDDATYESETTTLGPGDVAVLYTDGVSEALAPGGGLFGVEGLRRAIAEAPPGAEAVGLAIREAVRRHEAGADPSDDLTLICLART